MIKLLILSAGLFALAHSAKKDLAVSKDLLFGDFEPISKNDAGLKAAITAKKPEIIAKIVIVYPNITYWPKIKVNAAEKQVSQSWNYPILTNYRANITLLIEQKSPYQGQLDFPVLLVPALKPFNVSISSSSFSEPDSTTYSNLSIQGLPGVDEVPSPWGPWVQISANDTGILLAVDSVESEAWAKVTEAQPEIQRIPGSYIRNDFVITTAVYRELKGLTYPDYTIEYEASISLGLMYHTTSDYQYSFRLYVRVASSYGQVKLSLNRFAQAGFGSGINKDLLIRETQYPPGEEPPKSHAEVHADLKDTLDNLKGVISDLKEIKRPGKINDFLLPPQEEQVDESSLKALLDKLHDQIIFTVNYLNTIHDVDLVLDPLRARIVPGKTVQVTEKLGFKIQPPFYKRTYNLTGVQIIASFKPLEVPVTNLSLVLTEIRQANDPNGPDVHIFDEKLVQVNDYVLPGPTDRKKVPY